MMKSIRSKLIVLFGLILIVTLVFQLIFNLFYAERYYIQQKSNRIEKIYQMLRKDYVDDTEALYELLKSEEEQVNIRVMIFTKEGKMTYITAHDRPFRTQQPPVPMEKKPNFSIFREDAKAILQKNPMTDAENLLLFGVIKTNVLENRYIILEAPVSSIVEAVRISNRFTLVVNVFALALGILFVWMFSGRLTKPIKKIDKIAQNVAGLDFSERAEENGKDEIAHLSQNINRMSDRLAGLICDLKAANEELEADNRYKTQIDTMRKEFVANVSHELKTPISLLLGYAEMLKNDIDGIDKNFYCDVIIDESNKMNQLVCSLLDVSKLESGLGELKKETVDLRELLGWILEKNKIALEEKRLLVSVSEEKCIAECDKLKMEQVMTNYLTNAIRHAIVGSEIKIELRRDESGASFHIQNYGDTIEDKDIKKIWNSFYKADESRTDRSSTGLGLYIVKTIVQAHRGEIGVLNLENGVEFWFRIP